MSRHTKSLSKSTARIADATERLGSGPGRNTAHIPAKEIAKGTEKYPLRAKVILWIGGSKSNSMLSTNIRRSFPIMGYVGPNGGGKSAAMVNDTLPSLDRGRTVLSTVKLLDWRTGLPHPAYVPFTDFDQLLTLEHADVLMDEVVGIANSRSAASLSVVVQNLLVQLRRRDIVLRWTAPNWSRADKIIREVTQAVTECRGMFPGRPQVDESGQMRLWAPKRVFNFRTYDTVDFEEWTSGKKDSAKAVAVQWLKGPGSRMFAGYDTLDSVNMVAHAAEDGMCSVCGKQMRKEYCKGHQGHEPGLERISPEEADLLLDEHSHGSPLASV